MMRVMVAEGTEGSGSTEEWYLVTRWRDMRAGERQRPGAGRVRTALKGDHGRDSQV